MAIEQQQADGPGWSVRHIIRSALNWIRQHFSPATQKPEPAQHPSANVRGNNPATPAGLFVVYSDAQGLWAGRLARDPGRPKKLSVTIDRKLLSLPPVDGSFPAVAFVARERP
jgi:hypothetical protein